MPTTLKFRRGTTSEIAQITGAEGEILIDTTKDTVVVQDGLTQGGIPLATEAALANKVNTSSLATVATSGSYNDLTSKPTLATVATSGSYNDLSNKPTIPSITGLATETFVNTQLSSKQNTLVSGTSIKTVNGTSILGSGNIVISGGGGGGDLTQVSSDITPLFDGVYDIGSTTDRFYDAYLGNKLDINSATLTGVSTLIAAEIPAIPGSPETTGTAPVTVNFTGFSNGQCYVMGSSLYISETNANNGWAAWANTHWNTNQLVGATITCTSVDGTEAPFTTTITGFFGSAPNYGFAIANSQSMGTHIIAVSITYNDTVVIPAVPEVPGVAAIYDRTLATNASLVAPEVITDIALLGDLYVEGDTITPAHILGEYIDTKGTAILDGSFKVNDNLKVRNGITIQQEEVKIGKVISISQSISHISTTVTPTESWFAKFGTTSFSTYPNQLMFQSNLLTSATSSNWTIGSHMTIDVSGNWWKYQITNVTYNGMGNSYVEFIQLDSSIPNTLYEVFGYYGMNTFGQQGAATYQATITLESDTVIHKAQLDKPAIPLTSQSKLLVNGSNESPPILQPLVIISSNVVYDLGGSSYNRYFDIGQNWDTTTDGQWVTVKNIFANGNQVTIAYNGYTGIYNVSNVNVVNGGWGYNTRLQFTLTPQSGYDFVMNGNIDYALGMMGQQVNWSTMIAVTTPYNNYIGVVNTVVDGAYQSVSNFSWLSVGDELSYIPDSTSISFVKDDGTSVKAITYDNSTGDISYDGIVIPPSVISLDSNSTLKSSNTGAVSGSASVVIGSGANSGNSSDESVVIGTNTTVGNTSYASIAIGKSAQIDAGISNSIAIGRTSHLVGYGDTNIAIGMSANVNYSYGGMAIGAYANIHNYSNNSMALGYSSEAGGSDSVAIGTSAYAINTNNVALGKGVQASTAHSFVRGGNGSTNQSSPTCELHRWAQNFTITNQTKYIGVGNALDSQPNYNYFTNIAWYEKSTIYGTAIVMLRGVTENTTQWKIVELKFIAYTTSAYQSTITQLSATTLASGSDTTWNNAISVGVVTGNSQYMDFKVISNSTTPYTIGADFKATLYCFSV